MLAISFLELNSKGLYQDSGKEIKVIVLSSGTKCKIRKSHFVIVQRRLKNVQKRVTKAEEIHPV